MPKQIVQDSITASTTQTLVGARASALGANLDAKADVHIVTTCGNANDVVGLPLYDSKLTGTRRTIRNNGAQTLDVFPPTGGEITDSTGGLGANVVKSMASNTILELLCTDGLNYEVLNENQIGGIPLYGIETGNLGANRAILATESGKTFAFVKTANAVLTLPALQAGLRYRVQNKTLAGFTMAITSTGPNIIPMIGVVTDEDGLVDFVRTTSTTLTFTAFSGAGSYIDLQCDGTNWYATGFVSCALIVDNGFSRV